VREELEHLGPVVLFLVTILVVGDVCARAGLFVQGARLVSRFGHGRPVALTTGVFVLAATVTTVCSVSTQRSCCS
jgi:arsenical pump membrane protein